VTHTEIVMRAVRWLRSRGYHAVLAEPTAVGGHEIPDANGWTDGGYSVMVEAKTTRADFLKDRDKPIRNRPMAEQLGNERWFMTPRRMLLRSELPPGWGLVEVTDQKAFVVLTAPSHRVKAQRLELSLIADCLGRLQTQHYAEAFEVPEAWAEGKHWAQLQIKDAEGLEVDLVAEETEMNAFNFGDNDRFRRNALIEASRRRVSAMSDTIFRHRSEIKDKAEISDLLKIAATLNVAARELTRIIKTKPVSPIIKVKE
jgi:hypothetical protein